MTCPNFPCDQMTQPLEQVTGRRKENTVCLEWVHQTGDTQLLLQNISAFAMCRLEMQHWKYRKISSELKQSTWLSHSALWLWEKCLRPSCALLMAVSSEIPKPAGLMRAEQWQIRQSQWLKRQFHSVSLLINLTGLNLTILCLTEIQTSELSSRDISFLALHKLVLDMKAWIKDTDFPGLSLTLHPI